MNGIIPSRRKSGFTLIEILVVVAIIAILAAILFPVFARARENAKRASCQNNVKNIALAFKQYTQDNDENPPSMGSAADVKFGGKDGALHSYIKSGLIFNCPSDIKKTGSYGYDLNGGPHEASLEPSSQIVLLRETLGIRHLEGQNLAFVDGHVKFRRGEGQASAVDPFILSGVVDESSPTSGSIKINIEGGVRPYVIEPAETVNHCDPLAADGTQPGATINNSNGVFSTSYPSKDASYTVTFEVTDSDDPPATTSITQSVPYRYVAGQSPTACDPPPPITP